jgi:Fibronectin type III domain
VFFLNAIGVVFMDKFFFAAHSHIRNVVVCALITIGLAACGADGSGTGSATGSTQGSPNVGLVDRSGGSTTPPTTNPPASNPPANPPATNPPPVTNPTGGTATLDWTPPAENSDGSVLTDLAGYTVHYGTSPGNLDQSVKITNPGLTAYTMSNLTSGTWYFAVTAYSTTGAESSLSGVVSKTI